MEDVSQYIGIPHFFNEDSYEGCDCLGLCRLFYKEHGWKETFDDGKEITKEWQTNGGKERLFKYFKRNFDETYNIDDLENGDIVLFNILGDYHFGIYIDDYVLAMEVPVVYGTTQSTLYRKKDWKLAFKRGFKRRKE